MENQTDTRQKLRFSSKFTTKARASPRDFTAAHLRLLNFVQPDQNTLPTLFLGGTFLGQAVRLLFLLSAKIAVDIFLNLVFVSLRISSSAAAPPVPR